MSKINLRPRKRVRYTLDDVSDDASIDSEIETPKTGTIDHEEDMELSADESLLDFIVDAVEEEDPDYIEADYQNILSEVDLVSVRLSDDVRRKLSDFYKYVEQTEPTLEKIISARIPHEDKIRAIALYQDYKSNAMSCATERNTVRSILNDLLGTDQTTEPAIATINLSELFGLSNGSGGGTSTQTGEYENPEAYEVELRLKNRMSSSVKESQYKEKILLLNTSDDNKLSLLDLYDRLKKTTSRDECSEIRKKIEWYLNLPYFRPTLQLRLTSNLHTFVSKFMDTLDRDIYGLAQVKESLLRIAINRIQKAGCTASIALKGPPGVGKTSIAKSFAKAMNLPYDKISLGGLSDVTILKGSDSHWLASTPSVFLQILRRNQVSDGIILFDEIDKLSDDPKVENALLHVTDPTHNNDFSDNFLSEIHHDLSGMWFLYAMNNSVTNPALNDRFGEIIDIPQYSYEDMCNMFNSHLLPQALNALGMEENSVTFDCSVIATLVRNTLNSNGGVRTLKKYLNEIIGKVQILSLFDKDNIKIAKVISYSSILQDRPITFPYRVSSKILSKLVSFPAGNHFSYYA